MAKNRTVVFSHPFAEIIICLAAS